MAGRTMSEHCVAWAMTMVNTNPDIGYLLHSRPFRDSSVICDFFLQQSGRVSVLYKGVKKAGKPGEKGRLLQPFSLLSVGFDGRNELKAGRMLESSGASVFLQGKQLYCGLYVNELLVRLLHKEEPYERLFESYRHALAHLKTDSLEATLRLFEQQLLAEMGYEICFDSDAIGNAIAPQLHYLYQPDHGFTPLQQLPQDMQIRQRCFLGQHLLAIGQGHYGDSGVALAAKKLSRQALSPHLGDKPLRSRELFKALSS